MDGMLQQLHRQVTSADRVGSSRTATLAAAPSSTSGTSVRGAEAEAVAPSNTVQEMSATASALLRGIDQFDLFASAASSSSLTQPAAQRRLSAGRRVGAGALTVAAVDVHSGGFGSDEPIPMDAPRMSDAVMSSSGGGDEDIGYGSKVRYIGQPSQRYHATTSLGSVSDGHRFLSSLRRATQSVYFEELQFQLS